MNINQTIILRGYIAKEMAVYSNFIGKNGKESKVGSFSFGVQNGSEKADFLPITAFGQACDLIQKYTQVGTQLLLSCRLQNNIYKKREGKEDVYKGGIQIICEEFQILSQPKEKEEKSYKKGKSA